MIDLVTLTALESTKETASGHIPGGLSEGFNEQEIPTK